MLLGRRFDFWVSVVCLCELICFNSRNMLCALLECLSQCSWLKWTKFACSYTKECNGEMSGRLASQAPTWQKASCLMTGSQSISSSSTDPCTEQNGMSCCFCPLDARYWQAPLQFSHGCGSGYTVACKILACVAAEAGANTIPMHNSMSKSHYLSQDANNSNFLITDHITERQNLGS